MSMSNFGKIGQSVEKILTFLNFSKWRAMPSWIYKFVKFHWQTVSGRPRLIVVLNVVKIGRLLWRHCNFSNFQNGRLLRFFRFFKMAAAAILDCRIHKILLADSVRRAQTHRSTKFRQNRSFHCGDIAILQIFKMAAAAILDYRNREILLVIVLQSMEKHHRAEFRLNRSIGCEGIKIIRIFKMAAAAILDY